MLAESIKGKSVIVTGASKGIGKGIARVFARHGARVLVVARDGKAAEAVMALTAQCGVDTAIEAVGIPATFELC